MANPANSQSNLCLGGALGRFQQLVANSGASGTISISTASGMWSLGSIPQSSTLSYPAVAGESANFQLWHRSCGSFNCTSNFTDGVTVIWEP